MGKLSELIQKELLKKLNGKWIFPPDRNDLDAKIYHVHVIRSQEESLVGKGSTIIVRAEVYDGDKVVSDIMVSPNDIYSDGVYDNREGLEKARIQAIGDQQRFSTYAAKCREEAERENSGDS